MAALVGSLAGMKRSLRFGQGTLFFFFFLVGENGSCEGGWWRVWYIGKMVREGGGEGKGWEL